MGVKSPCPFYSHQTVNRVPHEVAIENLSLHPHIAANIAEPHSTKASVTPASSWWEIVMTHATVTIVAEGRRLRRVGMSRLGVAGALPASSPCRAYQSQ